VSGRTIAADRELRQPQRQPAWFVARASPPEARVVITTALGEEGQVDYGDRPMVRYPPTGKCRRTRLFVLTLGYSRKAVRVLVWRSRARVWAELHEPRPRNYI
jgi:hypothetical protein